MNRPRGTVVNRETDRRLGPRHTALEDSIVRALGRVPTLASEIHRRVLDDYGAVALRSVHYHLALLYQRRAIARRVVPVKGGDAWGYYHGPWRPSESAQIAYRTRRCHPLAVEPAPQS